MEINKILYDQIQSLDKNQLQKKLNQLSINFYKKGGQLTKKKDKKPKIHIKKENQGKFTDYCGGSVTDECIQRGKNSPDPKIRKRATFAANARKWKHQDGGTIKLQNYPLVTIKEEPWANEYFKKNPNVSGMAIGAGMNKVDGPRRVILNPYGVNMKTDIDRNSVIRNERFRHYMDETNFKLPNLTKEQIDKYNGTTYKNDSINIGRTEAARYLSGDNSNSLTDDQKQYIKKVIGYKDGGRLSNKQYQNTMHKVSSQNWKELGDKSEQDAYNRLINDKNYDYRGYYNKYPNSGANASTHWSDEFKTYTHPSFSTDSKYSGVYDKVFNPNASVGGTWIQLPNNEYQFNLSDSQLQNGTTPERTFSSFENNEVNGVKIRDQRGNMIQDPRTGIYYGDVLPQIEIIGHKK